VELLGGALLLFGGVLVGLSLPKWKRRIIAAGGGLILLGIGAFFLFPLPDTTLYRIENVLSGGPSHPRELATTWVGWDTGYSTPFCRLELEENGTGRCGMWYEERGIQVWRVTSWRVHGDAIALDLDAGDRLEHMRGRVRDGTMLLEYFGSDDPRMTKNWFGPLHLVPEKAEETARLAARKELSR
jgi:hypothetical protein